jgi:hypothetical protein
VYAQEISYSHFRLVVVGATYILFEQCATLYATLATICKLAVISLTTYILVHTVINICFRKELLRLQNKNYSLLKQSFRPFFKLLFDIIIRCTI